MNFNTSTKPIRPGSLVELYNHFLLPTDPIRPGMGFTIANLKDIHKQTPYSSPSFCPDFFSLIFIKNGEAQYNIADQSYIGNSRSVYFNHPNVYRSFCWNYIEDAYLITFDELFLQNYIPLACRETFQFLLSGTFIPGILDKQSFKLLENIYLNIYQEYQEKSIYKFQIIGQLLQALFYRLKEFFYDQQDNSNLCNRKSAIVRSFRNLLRKHYHDLGSGEIDHIFRKEDYAQAQNLHPNYLNYVIKAETGKPISAWIADQTVLEAKSLLKHTPMPIKEISYNLGFSEPAHFSNHFKKHTDLSPLSYRNKFKSSK